MFHNANALIDLADDNDRLLAENSELRLRLINVQMELAAARAQLAGAADNTQSAVMRRRVAGANRQA